MNDYELMKNIYELFGDIVAIFSRSILSHLRDKPVQKFLYQHIDTFIPDNQELIARLKNEFNKVTTS
jgi:hypothetical protein